MKRKNIVIALCVVMFLVACGNLEEAAEERTSPVEEVTFVPEVELLSYSE